MRDGADRIKIRAGMEFKLLAKLLEDGVMPFVPKAIAAEDLRDGLIQATVNTLKSALPKTLRTFRIGLGANF
jgi:hypothetical protein